MKRKYFYQTNVSCWICGLPIPMTASTSHPLAGTIDHVRPRSHGGTDSPINRKPSHRKCNLLRDTKPVDGYVAKCCREVILREFSRNTNLIPIGKKHNKLRAAVHFLLQNTSP